MPQPVNIPGVGVVNFPDTMSPEDINRAAAKLYTEAQPRGTPWTSRHPVAAQAARTALDTLPGVGAVVGGLASSPETFGAGTLPGMALGVGAGRGLRDLLSEGLGLEPVTTPQTKAGRIAGDTLLAGATQAVLPGLTSAVRSPGTTARELLDMLPVRLRWALPAFNKAAAAGSPAGPTLTRPGWQSWPEYAGRFTPQRPGTTAPASDEVYEALTGHPRGQFTYKASDLLNNPTSREWQARQFEKNAPIAQRVLGEQAAPVSAARQQELLQKFGGRRANPLTQREPLIMAPDDVPAYAQQRLLKQQAAEEEGLINAGVRARLAAQRKGAR